MFLQAATQPRGISHEFVTSPWKLISAFIGLSQRALSTSSQPPSAGCVPHCVVHIPTPALYQPEGSRVCKGSLALSPVIVSLAVELPWWRRRKRDPGPVVVTVAQWPLPRPQSSQSTSPVTPLGHVTHVSCVCTHGHVCNERGL